MNKNISLNQTGFWQVSRNNNNNKTETFSSVWGRTAAAPSICLFVFKKTGGSESGEEWKAHSLSPDVIKTQSCVTDVDESRSEREEKTLLGLLIGRLFIPCSDWGFFKGKKNRNVLCFKWCRWFGWNHFYRSAWNMENVSACTQTKALIDCHIKLEHFDRLSFPEALKGNYKCVHVVRTKHCWRSTASTVFLTQICRFSAKWLVCACLWYSRWSMWSTSVHYHHCDFTMTMDTWLWTN